MSYDTIEASIEGADPVEIIEITVGTVVFRHTSSKKSHTVDSQTYTPLEGLEVGRHLEGPDSRDRDFKISFPTASPLGKVFAGRPPAIRNRLKVSRFQLSDGGTPEVRLVFDGFVQSATYRGTFETITLVAQQELASLGKLVPRRTFQVLCNHVLYDPLTCTVDKTLPENSRLGLRVANINKNELEIFGLDFFADSEMDSGFLELPDGTDRRLVRRQIGNVVELLTPFAKDPSIVNAFRGCKHTLTVCTDTFGNQDNHGGHPAIPLLNPNTDGLI